MGCAAKGIFNSEGKTAGGTPWMGRERVPREMDDATGSARVGKAQRVRVLRVRASALRFLSRGKRSACSQGDRSQPTGAKRSAKRGGRRRGNEAKGTHC